MWDFLQGLPGNVGGGGALNFGGGGSPMGGAYGGQGGWPGMSTPEPSIWEKLGAGAKPNAGNWQGYAQAGMRPPALPDAQGQLRGLMGMVGQTPRPPFRQQTQLSPGLMRLLQGGLMG